MASSFLAHLLQEVTARQRLLPVTIAILLAAPATARAQVITICHATGGPNTPYQQIQVSPEESFGHLQHADDIVPAPPEGCPAQAVIEEEDPAYPLPTVTATPEPDIVPPPPRARPTPRRPRRPAAAPAPAQVAPDAASGNLGATATVRSDTLPLTGAEVPAIALMGFGFLLAGAGLRLRVRT